MEKDDVPKVTRRLIELIENATEDNADENERLRMICAAALRDVDAEGLVFLARCIYGLLSYNSDRAAL